MYEYDDYEPPKRKRRKAKAKEVANPVGMLVTAGAIGVVLYRVIQKRWPWQPQSTLTQRIRKVGKVEQIRSLTHGGR